MAAAPRGIFVTGTDTGVGKTLVTAALAGRMRGDGLPAGIFKPVCTGSVAGPAGPVWSDVEIHRAILGDAIPRERICPQCFHAPLAPPVAARAEGRLVDETLMRAGLAWWTGRSEWLFVEGVGGFLSPLTGESTVADFAAECGLPVLIVARAGLGTINHTLLTIEAIQRRRLPIAGVVLNAAGATPDASSPTNAAEIARLGTCPVLAEIPRLAFPVEQDDLSEADAAMTMVESDVWDCLFEAIRARINAMA